MQRSNGGLRKRSVGEGSSRNGMPPFSACLAVIVGVSLFMPDMVNRMEPGMSSGFGTAATMLGGSAALGYIVTGLLAFVLGVCVTIACFRICLLHKDEQSEEQKGDNANGTCR